MSTGLVTVAPGGRHGEAAPSALPHRVHAEPRRRAGVRARDPRAARAGDHADAVAAGQRLAGEQRGDVEQLADRSGADDPGVAEQRIDGRVGDGDQRGRVGGRRPGAGHRAAALDRDHRLRRPDASRDAAEAAGIAERLEVQADHVGARVALPVLQQVVAGEVGLVAGRDERRQAETPPRGLRDRGDPERAALRGERHVSRRRRDGREARVEADVGGRVEHAEAVRADEPHTRGPAHGQQLRLARHAGGADFGEAGREDDERPHAGGAALARDLHDRLGLDGDDGQLHRLRHVGDRAVGGQVAEGPAPRMHSGQPAAIARRDRVRRRTKRPDACSRRH